MWKPIFYLLLISLTLGCKPKENNEILPEYDDWYALKAPETSDIMASFGDIDNTLLIATRYRIYSTSDRGRTWTKARLAVTPNAFDLFGFSTAGDTLLALTSFRSVGSDSVYLYNAVEPRLYSTDRGINWNVYAASTGRSNPRYSVSEPLNRVESASGTPYIVKRELTIVSDTASVETTGIAGLNNELLTLPERHWIHSIRLDAKDRLYVSGSASLCGTLKEFRYCGDPNGILYVSKEPLP